MIVTKREECLAVQTAFKMGLYWVILMASLKAGMMTSQVACYWVVLLATKKTKLMVVSVADCLAV